jgi:hypothetical protein
LLPGLAGPTPPQPAPTPISRSEVADFYMSYARQNATTGLYELPYTCAQETCDQVEKQHNNHQAPGCCAGGVVLVGLVLLTCPNP